MRKSLSHALAGVAAIFLGIPALSAPTAHAQEPLPIEHWAVRASMSSVSLSPNGKRLAYLRILSKDGNPIIEIHDVDKLGDEASTIRLDAKKMEFTNVSWVGDDYLLFGVRQQVRRRIEGVNQGTYEFRLRGYNVKDREWVKFEDNNFGFVNVVSTLFDDPEEILISTFDQDPGDLAFASFIQADYYRYNLKSGSKKRVLRGNEKNSQASFDRDGNPVFSQGYDRTNGDFVYYYRPTGSSGWTEIFRTPSYDYDESISFFGVDQIDPTIVYVFAYNGEDKQAIWSFNTSTKTFGEKIFQHPDVDVAGIRLHHNPWREEGGAEPVSGIMVAGREVIGFNYSTDKPHTYWLDPNEEALFAGIQQVIPNAYNVSIASTSRDGSTMVITNVGPRDPGSYYLLRNGQLSYLGGRSPHIKAEDLADVKFIKYPTRDGDTIPAYLTVPKGEGPWPLIVLPHGGPHVSEVIVYDEWSQILANNGYLVMQPQYRGSRGWGLDHWQRSFGKWGYLMADDKDDGVKYLIENGWTEADKVAMFGWSYGGYAALAAAVRSDKNVYQCVISGAPVSDLPQARGDFAKGFNFSERYILDTYDGMSPVAEAEKIDMPVLLIHGDVDQRVPYYHAQRMDRALKKHNKDYKLVTLEKADHFSNTLFFNHKKTLYTEMLDWLDNRCGPNGLKE